MSVREDEQHEYQMRLLYAIPATLIPEGHFDSFASDVAGYKHKFCMVKGTIVPDEFITNLVSCYIDMCQDKESKQREEIKDSQRRNTREAQRRIKNLEFFAEEDINGS